MKQSMLPCLLLGGLIAACEQPFGAPPAQEPLAVVDHAPAANFPAAADGDLPVAPPIQDDSLTLMRVPLEIKPRPAPKSLSEVWREVSPEERQRFLRRLADRGSKWAEDTLRQLDEGTISDAEVAKRGDAFESELKLFPDVMISTFARRDGTAPMPFGQSMFGPWDTGTDPMDP